MLRNYASVSRKRMMRLDSNFIDFLLTPMGRNIYKNIPPLEVYVDYLVHLSQNKFYEYDVKI